VNALPTSAYAMLNIRIAPHESIISVAERLKTLVLPNVTKHKLGFKSAINIINENSYSTKNISSNSGFGVSGDSEFVGTVLFEFSGLETSPLTSSDSSTSYSLLGAFLKSLYDDCRD
jgi:acetylornithine deacetylase/succinyl-diaminopimelate desuccinylase-like protein